MKIHLLVSALLLTGCATSTPPVTTVSAGPPPLEKDNADSTSVRIPEHLKAYPAGRYQDPNDPDVMHEAHTVYRAETSPDWNTAPNAPTDLPLGPGEMATADPARQHTALTAELEQRLKQEDQLLQTTYEQNERLAQEIKGLQEDRQHVLLPVPPAEPPVAASQPKPPTNPSSQPSPVSTTPLQQKSWLSWLWPNTNKTNQKNK